MDLGSAILTDHAARRLAKRGIALEAVRAVLGGPESVMPVRPGRVVAQGMVGGQLLRVFVDVDRRPPPSTGGRTGPEVVTAYLTSRMDKYRRSP